jgi:hypothetical protein
MGAIKINERFTIERETECWILTETRFGTTKDGKPTRNERKRYFMNLHTAINSMVDLSATEANTLREITATAQAIKADICGALLGTRKTA